MSRRKSRAAAPAPAAVAPAAVPGWRARVAGACAFAIVTPAFWLLLAVGLAYLWLAWVISGQDTWWLLGIVDGQNLLAIDDAYRYYLAQTAWTNVELWRWNYALPVVVAADGLLATLTGGDLFAMRALHVPFAVATLWLVWLTGVRLGAGRAAMTLSVLVPALMPLYAFVFLSFYGENWLAFLLALGLFLFVAGRETAAALVLALLPLTRPEGLFFIVPIGLYWLLRRRWSALLLLGAPGFLYGVWLLATLEQVADYTRWRTELLAILQQAPQPTMRDPWRILSTFNALWLLPALAGFCAPGLRRWWPLWSGALLWLAYTLFSVAQDLAFYESRYLLSLLPVLALGWPFVFVWLRQAWPARGAQAATLALLAVLSLAVIAEHLLQMDPFRAGYGDRRWPVAGPPAQQTYFGTLSPRAQGLRRDAAAAIGHIAAGNPAIDRVLVNSVELFYYLDPALGKHLPVLYVPVDRAATERWRDGASFAMHPGGRQYGYYRFRAPTADDTHLALYAGRPDSLPLPAVFRASAFALYLVAYDERDTHRAAP